LSATKSPHLYSLRKRALYLSATISVIVLFILISAYSKLKETNDRALANVETRTILLTMFNQVRDDLLSSYKNINNFLLTPEKIKYKDNAQALIKNAIDVSYKIEKQITTQDDNPASVARALTIQLQGLILEMNHLFSVRLESTTMYPALAVAAEYMRPNRVKMNNLLSIIENEMQIEDTIQTAPDVYEAFIRMRYLWGKILSNFRISLANRIGSFDTNLLSRQEMGIKVRYLAFQKSLNVLLVMNKNGRLNFESSYAVKQIKYVSALWFKAFEKISIIHHSDNWRLDALIMKEKISPRFDNIVALLLILEENISVSVKDDLIVFSDLGKSQNKLLWGIAILGAIFIIVIIFSLDAFVFKPITLVVSALKSEALGKQGEIISKVKSQEAYDLFNAFSEMSRQVHSRQSELEYHALHDALTKLPNRTLLLDRMEHDLNTAKRENQSVCLLMLDLDRFKEVNDTLGHDVGDQLLVILGHRISAVLRDVDTVARFGGDEFAILLPHTDEEQAKLISSKIIKSLKEVVLIVGVELHVSGSIGIASYPKHSNDVPNLLRMADIAMYVAKREKTGFEVYNQAQDDNSLSKLSLTNDLRDAIENNLLEVYYQPVLNIKKNKIVGVEALCRWFHDELGSIPPDKFIPLAEHAGLINGLTYWVLEQSIFQLTQWHKIDSQLSIAVNISVYSFRDNLFVAHIRSILEKFNFPYETLTLEITEGAMMENPLKAVEVLSELRKMGVKLAVDDFGTGYSSMAYLKKLPVDALKIDKSFVLNLHKDKSDEAIVRSTIDLAHNLNLSVVAEGVETQEAWNLLKKFNCDIAQGYFMSKPKSAEEVEMQLLNSNK